MLSQQENQLIGLIYEAALNTALWSDVLAQLVQLTQSKTAIFTSCDQLNPNYDFVYTHNINQETLNAYQDERIKIIDMKLHAPLLVKVGVGKAGALNWRSYANMQVLMNISFMKNV